MKTVILAGGLGTRLAEETGSKPKPMVEIGGYPILWHIMNIYSAHGLDEFIICCGYKSYVIKEYFANYFLHTADVTFDLADNSMMVHKKRTKPWKVTLIDTGIQTMTGGRLKQVMPYLEDEKAFCFTYGDGVGDVDIGALVTYHHKHGKKATMTTAYPPGRFGALKVKDGVIESFKEKPKGDGSMINAGFFVLSPTVIDLIAGNHTTWEQEPLEQLALSKELMAFEHHGFWQPMDTLQDKNKLNQLWEGGNAPWKIW